MLTGDNRATAEAVARRLGITHVRADVKPEDKSAVVAELRAAVTDPARVLKTPPADHRDRALPSEQPATAAPETSAASRRIIART